MWTYIYISIYTQRQEGAEVKNERRQKNFKYKKPPKLMFNSKRKIVYNVRIRPNVTKSQIQHQGFLADRSVVGRCCSNSRDLISQ